MGIFDEIRKIVDTATGAGRTSQPPARPPASSRTASGDPRVAALLQAQEKRRAKGDLRGLDGKTLTRRRLEKYERIERTLVADTGAFPWTDEQARASLARMGFRPEHVEAYLRSPAARRLVE